MYLRERDRGLLAGKTHDERQQLHPEEMHRMKRDALYWQPPGGESIANLCLRVDRVIENLRENCGGLKVLLVCHGGVIKAFRALIERVRQSEEEAFVTEKTAVHKIHNGQIIWFSRRDPNSNYICSKYNWIKSICPWNLKKSLNLWVEMRRPVYSNHELMKSVQQVPQLVNQLVPADELTHGNWCDRDDDGDVDVDVEEEVQSDAETRELRNFTNPTVHARMLEIDRTTNAPTGAVCNANQERQPSVYIHPALPSTAAHALNRKREKYSSSKKMSKEVIVVPRAVAERLGLREIMARTPDNTSLEVTPRSSRRQTPDFYKLPAEITPEGSSATKRPGNILVEFDEGTYAELSSTTLGFTPGVHFLRGTTMGTAMSEMDMALVESPPARQQMINSRLKLETVITPSPGDGVSLPPVQERKKNWKLRNNSQEIICIPPLPVPLTPTAQPFSAPEHAASESKVDETPPERTHTASENKRDSSLSLHVPLRKDEHSPRSEIDSSPPNPLDILTENTVIIFKEGEGSGQGCVMPLLHTSDDESDPEP
eukprot:GHVR01175376.1.p1 GENE.GHVR01175376.1~~GHVR01175376.1.p1  ORF type:complete len:542 (-),score=50.72 GHVR01175376.1:83-1708(-)